MIRNYRDALGEAFVKLGAEFPELVVVTADVSKSTRSIKFRNAYPSRFYSVGIAEANAVGISAGMATFGIPVLFTAYAIFATEKPYEQIRNMIAYPGLNVTIVATHGGINVGEDGVTHQAVEDIAIMRAIPGMRVIAVADPGEVVAAVRAAVAYNGPIYVRIPRAPYEVIHDDSDAVEYEIGRAEVLRDGSDVTIIAAGMMVWDSLQAATALADDGISARVVNVRTIKPIDEAMLAAAVSETGALVSVEDHNRIGGLGGAVAEYLVTHDPAPLEILGVDDEFAESGNGYEVLRKYGLHTDAIVARARRAMERKVAKGAAVC